MPVFDARVASYAPAPDGRFLVVGLPVPAPSPPITVVVNWTPAAVKKKTPPR